MQLAIQVVQNRHAGEKKSHWEKTKEGNYYLELCMPLFVLSQCDFCSPAGRFCTTWMASCKGPIDLTSSGFTFKLLFNPFTYISAKMPQFTNPPSKTPPRRCTGPILIIGKFAPGFTWVQFRAVRAHGKKNFWKICWYHGKDTTKSLCLDSLILYILS